MAQPPKLGATFVPGGFDDYYMPASPPELVSPAPQRITPEVPENIQNNLANLELADKNSSAPQQTTHDPPVQRAGQFQSYQQGTPAPSSQPDPRPTDMPNFSPFPPVTAKPNVPPSDDEKEQILENARLPVLNSNDPEMQLAWAQDVLAYVATSQLFEERIAINQPRRAVTPSVEHQLRVDAMNIVSFLADQDHPKAKFMKGMWLEFGNFGMRQDKREAFRCYMRAAEQGYARAEYRMGMQFEQGNDPMKALQHYRRGAEAGDSASNYRLGMMTLMGQMGQQQDYGRGIQMLRVAAEHADENAPQGAYVLGMLLVRELPQVTVPEVLLPYDEEQGRLQIEKAAYLGFAKAQLKMGAAYELCSMGCEFDPALSLHYNSLAARQGEPEAEMAISKWFLCGYEGVFSKNEELAFIYAERAATSGLATAEFAMGYFHEIGMHVPESIPKAQEWYEKAAKNGNQDAIGRIEQLKQDQTLSKKDHEQVAINRIRSQHGSKRGARPDRFKAKAPDLPSVSDESEYPARSGSVAPYPLSADPPAINRPSSAAPYPMSNGPPQTRPAPAGGFFNGTPQPGGRPGSGGSSAAFHFNAQAMGQPQRPSTTVNDQRHHQGGQGNWNGGPQQRPQGPGGYGPGPGRGQPPPQDFGYSAPGPGPRSNSLSPRPGAQGGGMQDIGYVAPLHPRKQSPNPQGHGPPGQGNRPGQGPGPGPGPGQGQNFNRPQQGGGRPPHGPGSPVHQQGRPPPQRPGQMQQPPQQQPQQQPAKPKPAAPVGNGPKTFAEMGIPQQNKEGDCVVM